jgi:DNA (cytosine-5)-methyltransferase 1
LENVPRLASVEQGRLFQCILDELNASGIYHVYHELLNTKNYGLPQNRLRLFIIGIRKDVQRPNMKFTTPKEKKMVPLDDILIDHKVYDFKPCATTQRNIDAIKMYDADANYVATWMGFGRPAMKELAPTLCAKTCSGLYFTKYKRHIYVKEALALQGFPKSFKQVVSDSQMYKQIGNSMSVCVLVALFKELFRVSKI